MYSIVVQYHADVQYTSVAIKEDGIHESVRNLKLHTETVNALLDFGGRVAGIIKATQGRKENESDR